MKPFQTSLVYLSIFSGLGTLAVACAEQSDDSVAHKSQLVTASTSQNLTITVPRGRQVREFAILGSEGVAIEDRARIVRQADEGYAPIANLGSGVLNVGVEAATGSLVTNANLVLRDRSHVYGSAQISGSLTSPNRGTVDQGIQENAMVSGVDVTRVLHVPEVAQPAIHLEPDQHRSDPLPPGRYASLTIKSRSSLVLSAGEYFFENLNLEPQAELKIDSTEGRVTIVVDNEFNIKGDLVSSDGNFPDLLWAYRGTGTVFATRPLLGWVFAPKGAINLERLNNGVHEGAYFGKTVRVAPDTTVVHHPMPWLIQNVALDKDEVCSGESLVVDVTAADPSGGTVQVSINRTPTTSLKLQSQGEVGPRNVAVAVTSSNGQVESRLVPYTVVYCDDSAAFPEIGFSPSLTNPDSVQILVTNAQEFDDGTESYLFDFGDGTTAESDYPAIKHDYTDSMGRDEETKAFDVTVTVRRDGQPDVSVSRTLAVWNTYALLKKRNNLTPPTVAVEGDLMKVGTSWVGSLVVENREDTTLALNQRLIHLVPCDGDGAISYMDPADIQIMVEPGAKETVHVSVPDASLPPGTCSVDVHLVGATEGGQSAHASTSFGISQFEDLTPVAPATRALLNYLVDEGLVEDPDRISFEELQLLHRQNRVPDNLGLDQFYQAADGEPGEACDPDSPGAPPREGYSCLPTEDFAATKDDFISNAHKGDLVFVRACSMVNEIFSALDPVQTFTHVAFMAEHRSKVRESSGENDRILKHAYGAVGGALGAPVDGFEPDALRYFWPGTYTSTVREAFVDGKSMVDPVGEHYQVRESLVSEPSQCPGNNAVVYPLVFSASPHLREATQSSRLAAVERAKNIDGHYRFGAYSKGALMNTLDENMPPWASTADTNRPDGGQRPTVCSGLVRQAMLESGAQVDADKNLPQVSDVRGEAASHEGLYFYDAAERLAAAENLYRWTQEYVGRTLATHKYLPGPAPDIVDLLTNVTKKVPNQFVNCFVSDSCDVEDTENTSWQEPGTGFGVSPDNILNHYDRAEEGGAYGFAEPMVYRHQEYRRIYTWQASASTNSLLGDVFLDNQKVAGVDVEIPALSNPDGSRAFDITDENGAFEIEAVPSGVTLVSASKVVDGERKLVEACFESVATQWAEVDCDDFSQRLSGPVDRIALHLDGPSTLNRTVEMSGIVRVVDCSCVGSDDVATEELFGLCHVSPDSPMADMTFSSHKAGDPTQAEHCADEAGYRVHARCTLQDNGTVRVNGKTELYESSHNSCGGNDLEDSTSFDFTIRSDTSRRVNFQGTSNLKVCSPFGSCHDRGGFHQEHPLFANKVTPQ